MGKGAVISENYERQYLLFVAGNGYVLGGMELQCIIFIMRPGLGKHIRANTKWLGSIDIAAVTELMFVIPGVEPTYVSGLYPVTYQTFWKMRTE